MARLWRDQGRPQQARELPAPVYGWFTEGFDMRLIPKEAKASPDALSSSPECHFKGCDITPLPAPPNPLVGTWKLVSFQFEAEGNG